MSFKDLISNLSDQSVIKAVSKPVPKKIISCIGKNSLTASEISERISFPKEKIYYHLKKLVAFEILVVSEKEEIKGIVQKKYRLVDYPSTIAGGNKKVKIVDHVNFKDLPLKTLNQIKYKTTKFDYVKAMARKIVGSGSNNDIIIQKYETDNKIRKLNKYIIKTKNEISIVKEKIDLIITQISLYDDNEKIYDNQKKLLQENESFSKRISNYKNSVISSKDKISIINKNYNDEKNKRNNTLNDLLKKIEKVEKELLIQSNKKDQVESYIKNIYDDDSILKTYEKFNFKNEVSSFKIQKKNINEEISSLKSKILLLDEKIIQNEKAIELLAVQTVSYDNELNNILHQSKLFGPISKKVITNNELLNKSLETELLDLEDRKKDIDDKIISIKGEMHNSGKLKKTLLKSYKPDLLELKKIKSKESKMIQNERKLHSEIDSINQSKKRIINNYKNKIFEYSDLLENIKNEIHKIKYNNTSKDLKNETQILENKKIQKEAIENDVRFLKEDLYKDLEFFEKSKTIYDKEIGKEASKSDGLKYEIEKNDKIVLSLTYEIDAFKRLIEFHYVILKSIQLFENDTFKINFNVNAINKNNEDRSLEIILDGYVKTFNWSISQLKTNHVDFLKNKIVDENNNNFIEVEGIIRESKIVFDISTLLLTLPEKLDNLRLSLNKTRLNYLSYLKNKNHLNVCKDELININKKKNGFQKDKKKYDYERKIKNKKIKKIKKEKNKNKKIIKEVEHSIVLLKDDSKLLDNQKIENDFGNTENNNELNKRKLETESLIDNLKDSLKDHEEISIRLDKKVNIFEALVSNIEKENDKIASINHKIKVTGLEEENVREEKSREIEKIRLQISNYENEIISNKTWISSSRFEEKQVLGEIRLWKKELNSLNAEKKLINIEIEKSQLIASQKEAEVDTQRNLNIEKIQKEQNVEIDKEKVRQEKLKKIFLDMNSKLLQDELKILTVIKIHEKNYSDIEQKLKKVNEKIQKFKFQKKRELKKHESHIERSKVLKERISSKIITYNQQLNAEVSLSKEFEAALKDKILITASKVQELENKISFKSGDTYASFLKQSMESSIPDEVVGSQVDVLVGASILSHQKSIVDLKKALNITKKELLKKISSHKNEVKKIKYKISLLKKEMNIFNKKIKKAQKNYGKLMVPLKKLVNGKELLLKEKDVVEKSFINVQLKEQEKLNDVFSKRKLDEEKYNQNSKKLDAVYQANLKELRIRIKNQEDLRLLKVNQLTNNLTKVLNKAEQRMNKVDQLIITGEEVVNESLSNIDDITKKREQSSSFIKIHDKKIYMLDKRLEKLKYGLKMKLTSLNKKSEKLNNEIHNIEIKKLNLYNEKNALELELKSFEKKVISIGRDPSQIEFEINQNYKILDDLRQKSIKAKKENDSIIASRLQSKKEIAENMKTSEKMLKSAQLKYSDTISKLNIIEQNKVVSDKENKMNSINLSKIETEIVEKHSFFEELSEKVQSLKNIYALELSTTKKMLKELKNDYGSISTSSKKIKENEILITSFIELLITEKNKSLELLRNQYKENDYLDKTIRKMKSNFEAVQKEFDQSEKKNNLKADVKKSDLKNLHQETEIIENKIFELKASKKSESQQMKLFIERKKNLQKNMNDLHREHKKDMPVIDSLLVKKERNLSNINSDLQKCTNRILLLEDSLGPRMKELEKIENYSKNNSIEMEDLELVKENICTKIEYSRKTIRKIKKTIKNDTKKIDNEIRKNEESVQNLKSNLEQNKKSAKTLRAKLENNIRIKLKLNNDLIEQINEKKGIKAKIAKMENRLIASNDLKKLLMEHNSLKKEVKYLNQKLSQFHENFSALSSALIELKASVTEKIAPIEKDILDKEYEVLKDKDIMKQNNKTIKDYELRIKQSPSKLKSLDSQYKDQNRIKFQLDLKLKESVRNLEFLKKRSEIFESPLI